MPKQEQIRPDEVRTYPLNLSFLVTSLPVGGAEVLLVNLVRRLNRSLFAPRVICLKEAGALGDEVATEVPLSSNLLGHKFDFRVLPRLIHDFRSDRTDAVITVGAGDKMFWGRLAAKFAGVPVICSALHSTGWPDGIGRVNRLLTPVTDAFIACANDHALYLHKHEGFPAEKVFMIPNGVDVERFRPNAPMRGWLREQLGLALDCQLVGIVAALREEKNHQQFIEAAAKVIQQHPHTHFVVVGEGIMRQSIESWIASNRLESHFHLLGNRSDTERILAGLDVFALTSRNEANPVSILEALATGIPVVSPDVGSIHETVLHEKTGLLTTPLDAEGTAAAVSRLLSNPAWARELGLTGRANVRQNWSLDAMVQGYEKLVVQLYNTKAEVCGRPLWPVGEQQFAGEALSVPLPLLPDGQAWQVEPGANFSPTN